MCTCVQKRTRLGARAGCFGVKDWISIGANIKVSPKRCMRMREPNTKSKKTSPVHLVLKYQTDPQHL